MAIKSRGCLTVQRWLRVYMHGNLSLITLSPVFPPTFPSSLVCFRSKDLKMMEHKTLHYRRRLRLYGVEKGKTKKWKFLLLLWNPSGCQFILLLHSFPPHHLTTFFLIKADNSARRGKCQSLSETFKIIIRRVILLLFYFPPAASPTPLPTPMYAKKPHYSGDDEENYIQECSTHPSTSTFDAFSPT